MATKPRKPATAASKIAGVTAPGSETDKTAAASADPAAVVGADMKKKELIDRVVERSGIKKKDAKPVIEAMLAVLGESIAEGRELNLQPMGKLRINRNEEKPNGRIIVCKLRQPRAGQGAKTPLADPVD